jgi:hypothetical protein
MSRREITWPKNQDIQYTGLNGNGFCVGVSVWHFPERVQIVPINSKGMVASRCSIDLPAEPDTLVDIARALIAIAQDVREQRSRAANALVACESSSTTTQ